jgi:hypothetical protein
MPAVQLAKLKTQIDRLVWQFTRPQEFQHSLKDLFESYADRVYRAGDAIQPAPLVPAYHVSMLVMHQLEQQLIRQCKENQGAALSLADTLWLDEYLEPRLLAVFLVGQVSPQPPELVVDRLRQWSQSAESAHLQQTLFSQGSIRLRRERPGEWLNFLNDWLSSSRLASQKTGLHALIVLVQDREFEDLPSLFSMITPLFQVSPTGLHAELVEVAKALVQRSPVEIAYFLRQILTLSSNPNTARVVRRLLPEFSPELQASLRKVLQTQG